MRKIPVILACIVMLAMAAAARAGPVDKARNAVDSECSVGKAVKGAAQRATSGVGNRCKLGEDARDTVGLDGNDGNKHGESGGPLKKRNKD